MRSVRVFFQGDLFGYQSFLHDNSNSLEVLEELVTVGQVSGPMVHDARIAACCLSNGVRMLYTVDRDFSRFPKLKTQNPLVG